jgi:hypothetical protein
MKTTIEISDSLLLAAKEYAAKEGTTLRALVELGLLRVLEDRERTGAFKLRDVGFEGRGLTPEFRDAGWEKIRDAIYEGHGA